MVLDLDHELTLQPDRLRTRWPSSGTVRPRKPCPDPQLEHLPVVPLNGGPGSRPRRPPCMAVETRAAHRYRRTRAVFAQVAPDPGSSSPCVRIPLTCPR